MRIKKMLASISAAFITASAAALTAVSAYAEDATQAATSSSSSGGSTGSALLSLVIPLYFIAIKPQKKREREMKEMQDSLQFGDEIVTGGGIVGIVVRTGDDTVVIETGGERQKLRIKNWAITENVTAMERMKEAKAAAAAKKSAGLAPAKLADEDENKKSKKSKKNKDSDED